MIIEFNDISENKKAFGHILPLPEGVGLGKLFEKYPDMPDLSPLVPCILQCSVNGRRIDNWQLFHPEGNDRISFVIGPRDPVSIGAFISGLSSILSIVSAVITIAQFIISLFSSPQTPKQQGGKRESDTYAFEGIRDTFQLGSPISVTWGTHVKGGQVLMYYLTMMPENKGTKMHMLLSLGEGPVESVTDIKLNDISISELDSITSEVRLGTSSQAPITGFSRIRNTFHDGREITDVQRNGTAPTTLSSIIYRTKGYDVDAGELFVAAQQGLYLVTLEGKYVNFWSRYKIEYRESRFAANSAVSWTFWERRQPSGRKPYVIWDYVPISFPRKSQWDVKLTWEAAKRITKGNLGRRSHRLWLSDFTEIRGTTGTFSNEVLLAINASPTAQMHGGQPNATAKVKGRIVRVYTDVNTYSEQWTDNPAWPMVDWMTNSRYGLGADVTHDDVDIQSFLDFATLAESLAETCPEEDAGSGCPQFGSGLFYTGRNVYIDSKSPLAVEGDASIQFQLHSRYNRTTQNGLFYCRPCCPSDYGYGVQSGEFLNSYLDTSVYVQDGGSSGKPIFGLLTYVLSGTTQNTGSAYGLVVNVPSNNILLCRWKDSRTDTYGTILQTYVFSGIGSGDWFNLVIDQNYDLPSSLAGSNIWLQVAAYRGATNTYIVDTEYVDTSASRISHAILNRSLGMIALPNYSTSADYHSVPLYYFHGETGLCYGGPTDTGTHELTCIQRIPYYNV